jgi:sporulation protein YlmC with PRC-barrel domain
MRLSEIYGLRVRTKSGKDLGRIREVHCKDGQVTQLGLGTGSLLERLTGGRRGRRVAWEKVVKLGKKEIVVES